MRPKRPLDISTKLRCTQIIPILLPSTQKLEEPSISPMIKLTGSDSDNFMKITVDIPDEIAQRLGQTGDNLAHKLLEMVMGLPENKIPNKKIEKCFFEKVIIFV